MSLRSLLSAPTRREFPAKPQRRRLPRAAGPVAAGLSLVAGAGAIAALPTAATLPPPPTKALPSELDIAGPYVRGHLCSSTDKPGVVAFAKLLNATYGTHVWGISRSCGDDHGEGRALDWMVNANTADGLALGNAITRWLTAPDAQGRQGAMARRFGISYIIWNRQIWGVYAMDKGWRPYSGSSPHTDHIHITFTWDGAYQQTSWWTGRALTATKYTGPQGSPTSTTAAPQATLTPSGYPHLEQGAVGSDVTLAQKVVGADPDGEFGPATAAAIRTWQAAKDVPVTGELDAATWSRMVALGLVPARAAKAPASSPDLSPYAGLTLAEGATGPAVVALQQALGEVTADGEFGPLTRSRVETYQAAKGLPVTGVVAAATWQALMGTSAAAPAPATAASASGSSAARPQLALGSTGAAVRDLQAALGGLLVDGEFGTRTQDAVRAFQGAAGLPVTGVVDAATWAKLDARTKPLQQYYDVVLKSGSTGPAVVALQKALRVTADGEFGPGTEAAVKEVQRAARLAPTGRVARLTWQAIERQL